MSQRLLVYQSLWAMERRRPDGFEWSLDEKLRMIRDAEFDGVGVRFVEREQVREITGFLQAHGMSWQAQCYPRTVDDLAPVRRCCTDPPGGVRNQRDVGGLPLI
jgi:hypothetical protein